MPTFVNLNTCRTFTLNCSSSLQALTAMPCSEVIILNRTGQVLEIYDQGFTAAANALYLSAGESFTIRGITDSSQVSAKCSTGSGQISYRTQFFSSLVIAG